MQLPNWLKIFEEVCERGHKGGALNWGLPEQWVHAELYGEFKKQMRVNGWQPLSNEVPYITFYPVHLPKKRQWWRDGAVKWIDICLNASKINEWYWFEFKVRHAGPFDRRRKTALDACNAFRKDVVALMGFDIDRTVATWLDPDQYTKAYYLDDLKSSARDLRLNRHHFVAVFLQIGQSNQKIELDPKIWDRTNLKKQIDNWIDCREQARKKCFKEHGDFEHYKRHALPDLVIGPPQQFLENDWFIICRLEPKLVLKQ